MNLKLTEMIIDKDNSIVITGDFKISLSKIEEILGKRPMTKKENLDNIINPPRPDKKIY